MVFAMERKTFANQDCPIARALDAVGEWWSLLIIRDAFQGVTRFNVFQSRLGISRNALTTRLDKLVERGVFARQCLGEHSQRFEYVLTPMGRDLGTLLNALGQWGDRWLCVPGQVSSQVKLNDEEEGSLADLD
jgi:DNA-binding HxlR family transcriptional regulator